MKSVKSIFSRTLNFFGAHEEIGGFQISNFALQYVRMSQGTVVHHSLRLPPGVIEDGKIAKEEDFSNALHQFHEIIFPQNPKRAAHVVVVVSPEIVSTQVFKIPHVSERELSESAELNLQILSPIDPKDLYMDWQLVKADALSYELLGAFVERKHIDLFRELLEKASYVPLAVEFPALALSHTANAIVGVSPEPVLVFEISSSGLDFVVIVNGTPYVNYFHSWASVQGEKRQITRSDFDGVVISEIKKVLHFTFNRLGENPVRAFFVAPGFEDEVKKVLETNFGMQAERLTSPLYTIPSTSYIALGAAFRGEALRFERKTITLDKSRSIDAFFEETVFRFIRLWRNILTGTFGILFIAFMVSAFYLVRFVNYLSNQLSIFTTHPQQEEFRTLEATAKEFNQLLGPVYDAKQHNENIITSLSLLQSYAEKYRVQFVRVVHENVENSITFEGEALNLNVAAQFREAIEKDALFENVDLPLSKTRTTQDGSVLFTVVLQMKES